MPRNTIPNTPEDISPLDTMGEGDVVQFDAAVDYGYDVLEVGGGWIYAL